MKRNDPNPAGSSLPPGGAPAPTTPPAGGSTPPSSTTPPSDWTSGLNDDFKGYVQNKGFKDPTAVLDSYRNLEKLMGAPKERLLKLPEKMDDDAAMMEIYNKLGRPEKADDYNLPVPAGMDDSFAKWAKGSFHEMGLTKGQAEKFGGKWNEYVQSQVAARQEAAKTKITAEVESLKKEWGMAHDQNVNVAKNAAKAFGVTEEMINKMEATIGFAPLMKFMHGIGSKLGESNFVGGNSGGGSFSGAMAPGIAQAQIQALKQDPGFTAKYVAGDSEARAKMEHLHKMAYPGA